MAEDRTNPTEEIINQCVEVLEDKKNVSNADAMAIWKSVEFSQEVEQYKTCCLVKSREIWDLYVNLDLCYVITGKKKSELLKTEIQALCDKEKEMEQKLKDAVKGIKEVKTKLSEVVDEACKISRCIKEEKRCKTGLYEEMKKNKEWEEQLKEIEEHTVDCFNDACKAFDAGVDVIGIQTFVDMDSLKSMSASLAEKMAGLRTDVTGNIEKAESQWKSALEELLEVKQEIVSGKFDKCRHVTTRDGIGDTIDFLCDPGACESCDPDELEEICRKVKDNFGDDSGKEEDRPKQKMPPRKKRKDEEEDSWELD